MSKTTGGEWLKWAWVYGSLTLHRCDSLAEALSARWAAQDDEAFICIEGPEGVVGSDVIDADDEARYEADRARRAETPAPTCGIRLAGPNGERRDAWWETYFIREEAEVDAAALRERFGDRVSVVSIPLRASA